MDKDKVTYLSTLGSGAFGDVYLCSTSNGNKIAVKRFFVNRRNMNIGIINLKELSTMITARGQPNLTTISHLWTCKPFSKKLNQIKTDEKRERLKSDKMYIGMKVADGEFIELFDAIRDGKREPLTTEQKISISLQILNGVHFLHANNITHRDLKPNNILYTMDGDKFNVKVSDYGSSRPIKLGERNTKIFGNIHYNAPEHLCVEDKYDKKVDVWSLAITFIELFTNEFLFKSDQYGPESHDKSYKYERLLAIIRKIGIPDRDVYNRIVGHYSPSFDYDRMINDVGEIEDIALLFKDIDKGDQMCDLVKNMMEIDTDKRFTIEQCMKHPLYSGYLDQIKITQVKEHKLGNPHWMQGDGLKLFLDMAHEIGECHKEQKMSVVGMNMIFLALDIYHRVCQYLDKHPDSKETKYLSQKIQSVQVCANCIYIASKYYTDQASASFSDIFKQFDEVSQDKKLILNIEKTILLILDYRIYRPMVYDHVTDKKVLTKVLHYMIDSDDYYDYTPAEIAESINE